MAERSSDRAALGDAQATVGIEDKSDIQYVPLDGDLFPSRRRSSRIGGAVGMAVVLGVLLYSLNSYLLAALRRDEVKPQVTGEERPEEEAPLPAPVEPEPAVPSDVVPRLPIVEELESEEEVSEAELEAGELVPVGPPKTSTALDIIRPAFGDRSNLGALFSDGCFNNVKPAGFFREMDAQVRGIGEQIAPGVRVNLAAYARHEIQGFPYLAYRIYQGQGAAGVYDFGLFLSYRNIVETLPEGVETALYKIFFNVLTKLEDLEAKVAQYSELNDEYQRKQGSLEVDVQMGQLEDVEEIERRKLAVADALNSATVAGKEVVDELGAVVLHLNNIIPRAHSYSVLVRHGARIGNRETVLGGVSSVIHATGSILKSLVEGRNINEKSNAVLALDEMKLLLERRVEHAYRCLDLLEAFEGPKEELVNKIGESQQASAAVDVARWKLVRVLEKNEMPLFFAAAV